MERKFNNSLESLSKLNEEAERETLSLQIVEPKMLKKPVKIAWFTYIVAFTANLVMVSLGMFFIWPSPVIPKLKSNDTEINPLGTPITTYQIAIMTSTTFISTTVALLFMSNVSERVGRRRMTILVSLCMLIILLVMAFAKSVYIYCICNGVMGIVNAGTYVNIPIYNNEIAEPANRGKIGCMVGIGIPTGMLLGYIIGPLTSVKVFTLCCAIPPVLNLLLSSFLVESPVYLASRGKKAEAICSLQYLRKPRNLSQIEIEYQKIEEIVNAGNSFSRAGILDVLKSKVSRKALFISIIICVSQQTSGLIIIMTYISSIFAYSGAYLSGDSVGIIVGSVNICFFLLAAYFVDKLGRRPLLLFSCSGCAIIMGILAFSIYMKDEHPSIFKEISWLPVISVIAFIIVYGLGLGPIPITMVSELFIPEFRSIGIAMVCIIDHISISLMTFYTPIVSESFGICYNIFGHSIIGMIVFSIQFFLVPETKGKTHIEIQKILQK